MKKYSYDITVIYGGVAEGRFVMVSDTYSVVAESEEQAKADLLEYLDDESAEIKSVVCTGKAEE